MVNDDDLDWVFSGDEPQAQLFVNQGEKRWTVGLQHCSRSRLEGYVVYARNTGAIENRQIDAPKLRQLFRKVTHGCVYKDETSVYNTWKALSRIGGRERAGLVRRKLRAAPCNHQLIDRDRFLLTVKPQVETGCQEILEYESESLL